jgi:hypothetical protein
VVDDPLVARLLRAWLTKRSKKPGPLFVRVGKGDRILSGKRLSGDGIHKILGTMGDKLGGVIRPHGLRHAAITAALEETNGNVRATREFSGHASVEVLMKYDDNRKDIGGEVASKVIRRIAKLFSDAEKHSNEHADRFFAVPHVSPSDWQPRRMLRVSALMFAAMHFSVHSTGSTQGGGRRLCAPMKGLRPCARPRRPDR